MVSPLPRRGSTIAGRDAAGRRLRISSHPDAGRVVLSIWQDEICRATLRLAEEDVPELVRMLTGTLVDQHVVEDDRTA
ncbi:hypothetical protein FB474_2921 [Oryzihumus leptocrescens]|jgi:hypothetical protein|uniref:Uncharacterized protein n=2 Tax=Intrasporangiaceae TaxID=85021 RepID=A0A542ZMS5_9MICO|nr:hypothetical protein FB474_2921 [Oryzihumus leptocrescens]